MPKMKQDPWKPRGGVDEYAAPFKGAMGTGGREVKRAGDLSRQKAASKADRRGGGKSGY